MNSKLLKTVGELKEWLQNIDDDVKIYNIDYEQSLSNNKTHWVVKQPTIFNIKRIKEINGELSIIERPTKKDSDAELGVII